MKSLEYVTTESPENFLTSWKVCFDNISEPHEATTMDDISTINSDHGKPQWFSTNTLSRHTSKVCSLRYSRPGHCSTGPAPLLHCCDGDGRGRLTILRRCSQRHEGTEAEEFSEWGWIIEPDISSRINVDVWIILRISRYANICLTAHLFVGAETYQK